MKTRNGASQKRQTQLIRENRDLSTPDLNNRLSHLHKIIGTLENDVERFRALLLEAQTRLRLTSEEGEVIQSLIDQRR